MSNKTIERIFQAASAILIIVAGYFWWAGDLERVFVFAALGSLSLFIGFRFQVKERLEIREQERIRAELAESENGLEAGFTAEHTPAEKH